MNHRALAVPLGTPPPPPHPHHPYPPHSHLGGTMITTKEERKWPWVMLGQRSAEWQGQNSVLPTPLLSIFSQQGKVFSGSNPTCYEMERSGSPHMLHALRGKIRGCPLLKTERSFRTVLDDDDLSKALVVICGQNSGTINFHSVN